MSVIAWIILGMVVYLLIGIVIVTYVVLTDPYGGFVLHFAIPLVFLYPYFIVRSWLSR